jgi:DNA repair exonuclease SbcCD ATPase subunit
MRPVKLRMKHVGPFEDVTIDFAAITGNIIAISGMTGQGKTMTIESIFAAHHRNFPSRPDSIYKYCRGKDAQIELEFINSGFYYRSLLNIDAVNAEMEAFLFTAAGVPLSDGKVKSFKEIVSKRFGSESLILSSSFSAQNHKGSFVSLSKADRKSLFISMIDQVILEKINGASKLKRDACDKEYVSLAAKRDALQQIHRRIVPDRNAIRRRIQTAIHELCEVEVDLKQKQELLATQKAKIDIGAGAGDKKGSLLSKEKALRNQSSLLNSEMLTAKTLSASLENLRMAAEGVEEESAKLQEIRSRVEDWRGDLSTQETLLTEYLEATKLLQADVADHHQCQEVAKTKLERAQKDVKIIKVVPCKAEGDFAKCQFLLNAVASRDSIDPLAGEIDEAKAKCLALADQISALSKPSAEVKEGLRKKIAEGKTKIETAEATIKQKEEAKAKIPKAGAAAERVVELEKMLAFIYCDIRSVTLEIDKIEAEERELEDKKTAVRTLQSQIGMQEELIGSIRDRILAGERELSQADLLQRQVDQAKTEFGPIEASILRLNRDRRSWDLLGKAFGKTGIQSLEIDVAGPEVSAIANDLLFSCFGPRFSLKFRTQKPMADGNGFQDDFDIYVHDENRHEWCGIDDLSGGEKVIVGEAASLAIALYNREKSNVGWETIYRDEPSSALDDENAPKYITMLSKARELGHFEILYFISHQEKVKELADARIIVANGRITVQS